MRTLLFCFILTVITIPLQAQLPANYSKSFETLVIEPSFKNGSEKLLPFKKVVVIDSRFDTSKLGYIHQGQHVRKIATPVSFQQDMETALNKRYQKSWDQGTDAVLYLFIKHLWLQQTTIAEESEQKLTHASEQSMPFSLCKAYIECYLQTDSVFIPLLRLDSGFRSTRLLTKVADELLALPFQAVIEQSASINWAKKRKRMSWSEVQAFNSRNLQYSHKQKDTSAIGIYYTFSDFLHNRITKKEIEVTYGNITDELYIVEGSDKKIVQEFWGFCDGRKHYIKAGFNLFPIEPVGNTFEYWGAKGMVQTSRIINQTRTNNGSPGEVLGAAIVGGLSQRNKLSGILRRLQLNMETGLPY